MSTTDYNLRSATEADARAIRALIHQVGINPTGLDWRRFIIAVGSDDRLIGGGQIKPHGRDVLELASIAVQPEHQGRGIATAIIKHLLASSPRPLYLMCRSSMSGLYARFGFRVLSYEEMPRYFQRMSKLAGLADVLIQSGDTLNVMKLE